MLYSIFKKIYFRIRFIFIFLNKKNFLPLGLFPIILRRDIINSSFFIQNRYLENSSNGYWELKPKLTSKELNEYYSTIYYKHHRKKIEKNITPRDLDQFMIIKNKILDLEKRKLKILNFGSGYSGLSYLFMLNGHEVINVDPACENNDNFGIKYIKSLDQFNDKTDFFFSSHSLEHVENLDSLLYNVSNILNNNGYLFIEVPNCGLDNKNGGFNGKIIPPHTYYFRKEFFKNLNYNLVDLNIYSQIKFPHPIHDEGEIIRYIGKK